MTYKPTEWKYVAGRMAIFALWPGLPVLGLLMWLTPLTIWQSMGLVLVIVLVIDILVESMRKQSDSDGS